MDIAERLNSLADARGMAEAMASCLPGSIPAAALPVQSKLPFDIVSLREMLFHRASALATPAVSLLEARNVVSGVLLTRALIETVAMLVDLHEKLEDFVKSPDVDVFHAFLMKSLFANRYEDKGVKHEYFTSNILSSINRLDKKSQGIRQMYDVLSEYAHPNYNGVFGTFGKMDQEKLVLNLGPNVRGKGNDIIGAGALAAALTIFEHYYNAMPDLMTAVNQHFEPEWPKAHPD
jgi:hypothetical protein